jgi:hypothetical protein
LANNDQELAYYTAHLAYDKPKRLQVAEAARAHVEKLADPQTILVDWERLFASIETADCTATTADRGSSRG